MTRCLVIGASGFLGRHLLDLGPDCEVIGTDHLRRGNDLRHLDLRNPDAIRDCVRDLRPELIVYAAGMTSVDVSEDTPADAFLLNAHAPANLAAQSSARFIYLSTDYVFDGERGQYAEDDEPHPLNAYGRSKLEGERRILAANPHNVVLRVSGLFDLHGTRDGLFNPSDSPSVIAVEDDRHSSPIHVLDVRSALTTLLAQQRGGVFHAGGPHPLSRYEFRQIVNLHTGAGLNIQPTLSSARTSPARRPRDTSLRSDKLRVLGWRPTGVADWFSRPAGDDAAYRKDALPVGFSDAIDAVLLDCIGALLAPRNWLPADPLLEAIDAQCAQAVNGSDLWNHAATLVSDQSQRGVQASIAKRYAPNPDIWNALPALRRHASLALTNNGPSATFRLWVEKYGLHHVFEVLANSEELGRRKPDPQFYLQIADRLGANPARCLVLDDDERNVEGARECGMQAIRTIELPSPSVSRFADSAISAGA